MVKKGGRSKEAVLEYFNKSVRKLQYSDYEDLAPKHLGVTLSHLTSELQKRKVPQTTANLAILLAKSIEESEWGVRQILEASTLLELEYVSKHSKRFQWQGYQLLHNGLDETESSLRTAIRRAIRSRNNDADVHVIRSNDLFWLAVLYKRLDIQGLYDKPVFFAISSDMTFLFTKKKFPTDLAQAIFEATRSFRLHVLKLEGNDVPSLLRLLKTSTMDNSVAELQMGPPIATECGIDYTGQTYFDEYMAKCVDAAVELQSYRVTHADRRWLGDNAPELSLLEFHSEVEFSGNVTQLLTHLPIANICFPPFPSYVQNFMTSGRSAVNVGVNVVDSTVVIRQ